MFISPFKKIYLLIYFQGVQKKAKKDESADDEEEDDSDFEKEQPKKIRKPDNLLETYLDVNLAKFKKKFPQMTDQDVMRQMAKDFINLSPEAKKQYELMTQKSKKASTAAAASTKPGPASSKKLQVATPKKTDATAASPSTSKAGPSSTKKTAAASRADCIKTATKTASPIPDWAVKEDLYPREPFKPYP